MKLFSFIVFVFVVNYTFSQQLSQVCFTGGSNLSYISLLTDQGVQIRITGSGDLTEWGNEVKAQQFDVYAPKLQPFMGRVDYYGPETDSVFRGKVKSIGTCVLTYYGAYEIASKAGKLKSVGSVNLDYYTNYDNEALRGKIRQAGAVILEYYSSFDDEAFRGKLKTINTTPVTYYSAFDDKLIRGKVKSIGNAGYTWFNSRDRKEYQGVLKTGSYRQVINGITFILR